MSDDESTAHLYPPPTIAVQDAAGCWRLADHHRPRGLADVYLDIAAGKIESGALNPVPHPRDDG